MPYSEEVRRDLERRMRRVEGQVRGVLKMINDDRSCEEILVQLAAIRSAVNRAGLKVIGSHLVECICVETERSGREQAARKALDIFMKFS